MSERLSGTVAGSDQPSHVVLDSWAILALLEDAGEAGARTERLILDVDVALMSWMNVGEVACIVERRHGVDASRDVVGDLQRSVDLVEVTSDRVLAAASVKAAHPLAFADAFAAALAVELDCPVATGDPELLRAGQAWQAIDLR